MGKGTLTLEQYYWAYYSHVLEKMISGRETIEGLKQRYSSKVVDFFVEWREGNKPKPQAKMASPKGKGSRKNRKKRKKKRR